MSSHPSKTYKDLMNYIHNELGITKDDIRGWVHDAVTEVAENYLDTQFSQRSLDARIMDSIRNRHVSIWGAEHDTLDSYVKKEAVKYLVKDIKLNVSVEK